jgi:hypothetical protein
MTEHGPQLPKRDPHSVVFEADYWSELLEAMRQLNELQRDAANALVEVPIALLELLLLPADKAAHEKASAAGKAGMAALSAMSEPIDRILNLALGRLIALREEAGLPPLPDPGEER